MQLADLTQEIAARHRAVEDKQILIQVLERDGHDVSEQEAALRKERSDIALQITRQFQLIQQAAAQRE
ncbi:hypothetical protein [Bradyrhizobium symbiodeficiens]|uniref:hypothetical protein n=1 Tax=Bradyrhizobium symbiodeficiens TaxID=1404367 RepID=UPI001FCE7ACC|nr:hypothetical protein [Bradyrhizobium symbiodeficiens]